MEYDYDLVVLGAGPGGYVGAIRASQLGLKTCVIEKNKVGGVCLNIGCIPSKSLIHQAEIFRNTKGLERMGVSVDTSTLDYSKVQEESRKAADTLSKGVQYLLKKNKIDLVEGEGVITEENEVTVTNGDREEKKITGANILIATGSSPKNIPGFDYDGERIINSNDALMMTGLPENMIILGAGAIGCEFAHIMNSFGVQITIVEMLDQILPNEDPEAASVLSRSFKKRKIKMHTSAKASNPRKEGGKVLLDVETKKGLQTIEADKLLVVVGRGPNTGNIGLEKMGISLERGFVKVGDYYHTGIGSIYAVGDIVSSPLLAHVATKEAEIAVEHMAGVGEEKRIDPASIPAAVYTEPEVAGFGLTQEQAEEQGLKAESASFPYRGAGKSVAIEKTDGMVKITYDFETKKIIGGRIVGAEATDLIHELLLAANAGLKTNDISRMIHAHPTLSEAVMEAARAAEGWVIHA
ncbi:MAG: dihydrolipoyl dehydrogenase [Spirochaetia bacterium]